MAIENVLQEVLALPSEDRARVLEALQESLEPDEEWGKRGPPRRDGA